MKKSLYMISGVALLLAATTSCSNKEKGSAADTDTIVVEEAVVATVTDSTAALFMDPAKGSELATDSTYAQTPTGLKYLVMAEGTGKRPGPAAEVTVHYEGRLTDGTVFDSSYERGEPATFPLDRVIPGWTEGLQLMKEGGKTVFYIPSDLAYGAQGAPGAIPPNSDLVFTVELIKVN